MNRKISVNLALAIAIIAMAVTFSVTMIFSQNIFESTVTSVREKEQMYDKISQIDKTVRDEIYYPIDDTFLYDMLATGYMAGTQDPYARYYSVNQYVNYLNRESGEHISIGFEFYKAAGQYPIITLVYPNSPMADLGFVTGYTVQEINDLDLRNLTHEQISNLTYGAEGSTLTISYTSLNSEVFEDVSVQRRIYEEPSIQAIHRENEVVGYIKIIEFKSTTAQEIQDAIDIMTAAPQGFTALIIDVRNNNGGSSLGNVLNVIDTLSPSGSMGYQIGSNGDEILLGISDDENSVSVPMSIIVNENTQQGAELFALSVKELSGAQIVGTATAGMGSVQSAPIALSDGSAISYTVGTLISSNHTEFNVSGILPNVEVPLRDDELETFYFLTVDTDTQIMRARELALSMATNSGAQSAPSQENELAIETVPEEGDEAGSTDSSTDSSTVQDSQDSQQNDEQDSTENENENENDELSETEGEE